MQKINEKELKFLFNNIRSNDEASFNELFSKYRKLVYGVAFSILKSNEDSEDIVQTVFSKIYSLFY